MSTIEPNTAHQSNILIIGEPHKQVKPFLDLEIRMLNFLLLEPTKEKYALCLEPGFEVPDYQGVEKMSLWPQDSENLRYHTDQIAQRQKLTNEYAANTILGVVQSGRSPIALCGNAHLFGDFSIQKMLEEYDLVPRVIILGEKK